MAGAEEEGWKLERHDQLKTSTHVPVVIAIADGFGESPFEDEFNAVHVAHTPTLDSLKACSSTFATVEAHGPAVGLPTKNDMGNSEVGHNALGSGRVISQGASLVDNALASGTIWDASTWRSIAGVCSFQDP
jgi:2,3-bisphosphoglycerate-independent phosphoglycerate mutase